MARYKPYRYAVYLLARAGGICVGLLPRPVLIRLGRWLGWLGYALISVQRKKSLENLRLAFGREKDEKTLRRIARESFAHLTLTALEVLQYPRLTWEKASRFIDTGNAFEVYRDLLKEGHGLISITAHMGNWELLAGSFALSGTCGGAVVARRLRYEPFNRWIMGLRQAIGLPTLYRDGSGREIMAILKRNEVVGLLPDQDIDSLKGIFVEYFGRPAYTSIAPVRMALSTGAPIIANFMIREKDGSYKILIGGIIRPVIRSTREEAVRQYTQAWMQIFEQVIRQYPEQWAWMHNRWKTRMGGIENGASDLAAGTTLTAH